MTSAISREEIEDELCRAGIRSTFIRARIMRAVDLYALGVARRQQGLDDPGIPASPFAELLPGESDLERKVTRCKSCGTVKFWKYFRKDKNSPSGHGNTCGSCLSPHKHSPGEGVKWKCDSCGRKKTPEEFPPEKAANPRVRINCLSCKETPEG